MRNKSRPIYFCIHISFKGNFRIRNDSNKCHLYINATVCKIPKLVTTLNLCIYLFICLIFLFCVLQVSLLSMQKFQPRITIQEISGSSSPVIVTFPQTAFIAVTAYQNQEVTSSICCILHKR